MCKHKHRNSRRNFLKNLAGAGCASLTLTPFLSGVTNLGLINAVAANNTPLYITPNPTDYKALVCIMLSGGNDSYNMLVPKGNNSNEYNQYQTTRGGMALDQGDLLGIIPDNPDSLGLGREFGLHPSMDKIQGLFDTEKYVSFVANVGTLLRPNLTITDFNNGNYLPYQLFSHADQSKSWQTGVPEGRSLTGWGGRMADILASTNQNQNISMNIALNGTNIFQRGDTITEYVIQSTGSGSVRLTGAGYNDFYNVTKRATLDSILDVSYQGVLEKAYANELKKAKENSSDFSVAINDVADFTEPFPNTSIGNQLKMVAKAIATRGDIGGSGFSKQTFYVTMSGFDNHNNLLENHTSLMGQLDKAIYAFYKAMEELGTLNNVVGCTMSDFARTLTSNGDGTDHAWGGNVMVFGGDIDGGKIFGDYPILDLNNNNLHVNGGRLIPTTSCDEYFAELALWFGVLPSQLSDILPNIGEFWSSTSGSNPIGFLS